jgi:chromatin segregation and condensation protein Rec8/ScpA/Scc1 (kleisin family)
MDEIEARLKAKGFGSGGGEGKLNFRDIVGTWNREEIVSHFIPLLHLEKNQKITTEQEEFFKEIFISVKKNP